MAENTTPSLSGGWLRDSLLTALVALALAVPIIGLPTATSSEGLAVEPRWGAVAWAVGIVFVGRVLLNFWWSNPSRSSSPSDTSSIVVKLQSLLRFIAPVGVLFALILPTMPFASRYVMDVAILVITYIMLGWGLNIVVGLAGLLDLGYVAFYAIGAYSYALLAEYFDFSFWLCLPLAGVFAALFGVLLGFPVLRLRGDYLAIVTLGLGEVVRILANNLDHPINITNGPQGITPVGRPPIDWFRSLMGALGVRLDETTDYQLFFYLLVLAMIGLVVLANVNLANSRFGRAWVAIREDEIAAQAMGIPLLPTKLIAFMTGAAFSGVMGVIYGAQRTFVSPESFTLLASITILAMVILGGMGSIPGAILGAAALTILNLDILKTFSEFVRTSLPWIPSQVDPAKYERLVFGLILVLMMIYRPQGLIPEARHRAELEEEA